MSRKRLQTVQLVAILAVVALQPGCPTAPAIPDTVPDFTAAVFSAPSRISNRFFPVSVGSVRTYESQTPDGLQRIVAEVLEEFRSVSRVTCLVVQEREFVNDLLMKETRNFFAQDNDGHVWLMGKEVDVLHYDDQGNEEGRTHEGSWESGEDVANTGRVARPGIVMQVEPMAGDRYHQEFYRGQAEDETEVVAVGVPVTLANGMTFSTVQIRVFSALKAFNKHRHYAEGVGLVLEQDAAGGPRLELAPTQ